MTELQEAASAALTDFVCANGSDFDAIEWPGMAWLRSVLDAGVPGAGLDVILMAALADMAAAYHHEREHEGHWTHCQRPRCQNARLAGEGRGPFAAAQADTARPDDLDVAARAYLNDPDGYTAARLRAVLDTRPSRADTDSGELEALDWAITSLDNVRSVYPPGAEYWADDQRQKMNALRSLRAALAEPSRDAGLDAAWAAAEAALPDGWRMLVGREVNRPYSYWATASEDRHDPDTHAYTIVSTSHDGTLKLTAADAIRELIALLDARLAADGAPFPAGVNRADSEGER